MTALSDYLEDGFLNVFRGTAFPLSNTGSVYVGLFTAAPSDSGGGTEVSGNAYARVGLTKATGTWNAPSGSPREISNVAEVAFPTATGSWGTITHIGIFDASSAGNLLYWGALAASKAIATDDVFRFIAGALKLRID